MIQLNPRYETIFALENIDQDCDRIASLMNVERNYISEALDAGMRGWSSPSYVAADCQHDAIEKVAEIYETENKFQFNVEFVAEVIV